MSDDERWMRRALELAVRGSGETSPNPLVGCVVVRRGRVVGEGHHARVGGPHAEVVALRRAGAAARGATLYVNLEPCAHRGRTPACAPAVAASGVERVVAAIRDPNPAVAGRGLRQLRRSGVEVATGVLSREARRLNLRFLAAAAAPRPFVMLKVACTLDGRVATRSGDSRWITSGAQRRMARRLRRLHDAVAVGIGTALADDPLLLPAPRTRRRFVRIVFDSRLRLPPDGRLARSARRSPVWALCAAPPAARRRALEARGVRVLELPGRAGRVALKPALAALRREGLFSVMVEGGGELLGGFLAERLLDQVVLFRGPLLLGGAGSRPAFGGPDPDRIAAALRLERRGPHGGHGDPLIPELPMVEVWYPGRERKGGRSVHGHRDGDRARGRGRAPRGPAGGTDRGPGDHGGSGRG
jgi:diaminohydroxyphosphoribosylaminopyrimidine deaminase/5-amino-6-(5-phosphoribosylamino)uracil reductase